MHLLFDPVVLAVPGGVAVTAETYLAYAAQLLDWDEIARGVQHPYCVPGELKDALVADDCYPDAATLYRRWGPAGVRMSPDTVATVARSILDRTPTLERFFAADLGGVQVEEKQVSIQPDLLARLPEQTAAAFCRALARVAWLRQSVAAPTAGHNPADLWLATQPVAGPVKVAAIHAEVLADDGGDNLLAVDSDLPLATHPRDLDRYFKIELAWREPAAAIRAMARVLLNEPFSDRVVRRLERLRIGKAFCASIEGCQIHTQRGYLESVFRKCVMVLADDPSIHDEEQHHRLRKGSKPISDGRWQAWRLWVNRGNPGYRLHYWRDNDEFCFMNVRFHGDLSIDAPPEV